MPEPVVTTARSPRLSLPYLFPGQAQKEAFVNEALTRLDALAPLPVVLGERAAPPADPAPGDCHLVAPAPTGAWAGEGGAIACWADTHWLFTPPTPGMQVHDRSANSLAVYDAAAGWRRVAAPPPPAGGTVQDIEARAAIAAIVAGLRQLRIFA